MKTVKRNLIKLILLKATFISTNLLSTSAYGAEGWNVHLDQVNNPLNYQNLGCLVKRVDEFYQEGVLALGGFYADGDEAACLSLCAFWKDTFTKSSKGASTPWETKVFRTYPSGYSYNYDNMTKSLTAKYLCQTEFSINLNNPVYCGPDAASTSVCNPSSVQYPLPTPTCSMNLNKTVGITSTTFSVANYSASSQALSCEIQHHGVNTPVACSGANYTLGKDLGTKNSTGTHNVKFVAKGFGGDRVCSANYNVYNPVTCSVTASVSTLSLAANTKTTINWSSSVDATTCDYYKDGILTQAGISCSGTLTLPVKDIFTTTGIHSIKLIAKGKGGDSTSCTKSFTVNK